MLPLDVCVKPMKKVWVNSLPRSLLKKQDDYGSTDFHVFCEVLGNECGAVAREWQRSVKQTTHVVQLFNYKNNHNLAKALGGGAQVQV